MIGAIIVKRKARSAFASLSRHDLDAFLANWTEDSTFVYSGNLSVSGEVKGKQAIKKWFQRFVEQFPVSNFSVKNICVKDIFALGGTNVLSVEWNTKLRNREGEEFQISGVTAISSKGYKVILARHYTFNQKVETRAWGELGMKKGA